MSKELRNIIIAAGLSLIFALITGYFVYDTGNSLAQQNTDNAALEEDIKTLQTKAADLKGLNDQLAKLTENFNQYIKILPTAEVATDERLRTTVQGWCNQAQIEWDDLTVEKPRPAGNGFVEVAVSIHSNGSFDQFLKFLNLLERHEQFFKVNSFSLSPTGSPKFGADGKQVIDMGLSMSISTFTYVTAKK